MAHFNNERHAKAVSDFRQTKEKLMQQGKTNASANAEAVFLTAEKHGVCVEFMYSLIKRY